ncbi:MAG: hypothetical protein R3C16_08485 [Hyphomonadaceae bacterium]
MTTAANALGALAISVPSIHRGKGSCAAHDRRVSRAGATQGPARRDRAGASFRKAPPPVRADGRLYRLDRRARSPVRSWLRSHAAAGGRIVAGVSRSMVVEEPVAFWEMWSGRTFDQSGEYAVDGGLAPVAIDLEHDAGRYIEPNVWFQYAA